MQFVPPFAFVGRCDVCQSGVGYLAAATLLIAAASSPLSVLGQQVSRITDLDQEIGQNTAGMSDALGGLDLTWPVPSHSTDIPGQDYGQYDDVVPNQYHSGIDIPAPTGTDVIAAAGGDAEVILLSENNDQTHCFGNVIVIDHDNMAATLYAHLKEVDITDGRVIKGEVIGGVGNTDGVDANGNPCNPDEPVGNHLHFELKDNAVLGTTSDDAEDWGYFPTHPDNWGFHDPVVNLHTSIAPTNIRVEVTSLGDRLLMRTGPGIQYRTIGATSQEGQEFDAIAVYDDGTTGCSNGWYQVVKKGSGGQFTDLKNGGALREVWVCRGNNGEDWVRARSLGRQILVSDSDGNIAFVDIDSGAVSARFDPSGAEAFTDIAFDPSGNLFGVTFDSLYAINWDAQTATLIANHHLNLNALAIDSAGSAYAMSPLSRNLFRMDLSTGSVVNLGDTGFFSDGDLVFAQGELVLSGSTNRNGGDPSSKLIRIDRGSTRASSLIGDTGIDEIFGLAVIGQTLFGVANTDYFEINKTSGSVGVKSRFSGQGLGKAFGASVMPRKIMPKDRAMGALRKGEARVFAFDSDKVQDISLQTNGLEGDTLLELFTGGELRTASQVKDDDSGPGRFSRLQHMVNPGSYLIRITAQSIVDKFFLRMMSDRDALVFTDSHGHFAEKSIRVMSAAGITGGCGRGVYCPRAPVTRAQMAVFLLKAIKGGNYVPPPATGNVFNDIDTATFGANFIEKFSTLGITSGCGGGNYCPDAPVTREQMAVFLLRAWFGSGHTPPHASRVELAQFNDISDSFAKDWIVELVNEGITGGCGANTYCPTDPVTRGQMAAFIQRTFDLDVDL